MTTPSRERRVPSVGLYVHVPFCVRKCPYCDFATVPYRATIVPRYVDALLTECARYARRECGPFTSIFLGGGTPSLLTGEQVARILHELNTAFEVRSDAEITLEANPEDVDRRKLESFRAAGVNRLSIGAQAFDDEALRSIGRGHSANDVRRSFAAAREAGFHNINLDLMFGLPGQSCAAWGQTLRCAIEMRPEHLSVYCLTIERKTVFGWRQRRGDLHLPDEDVQAAMMERTIDELAAAGYRQYEISNFARPGLECRHNLTYWKNEPYLGLGAGAWGYLDGERYGNIRGTQSYIKRIEEGRSPVVERERLQGRRARAETVILALRTREGMSLDSYQRRFGASFQDDFGDQARPLVELALLEWLPSREAPETIRLTRRGILLADEVLLRFLPTG